ncbi:hypothetical protein [Ottowia sp. VDI28]|uniref:hypothetical protein n=1 Tax=Ottowia sp. VDI28 TaxID=3133968 RepID=UPI003C30518B
MGNVIQLRADLVMAEADYRRPPLAWITLRARRIERAFKVARRMAVVEAVEDYFTFTGMHRDRILKLIQGGQHV